MWRDDDFVSRDTSGEVVASTEHTDHKSSRKLHEEDNSQVKVSERLEPAFNHAVALHKEEEKSSELAEKVPFEFDGNIKIDNLFAAPVFSTMQREKSDAESDRFAFLEEDRHESQDNENYDPIGMSDDSDTVEEYEFDSLWNTPVSGSDGELTDLQVDLVEDAALNSELGLDEFDANARTELFDEIDSLGVEICKADQRANQLHQYFEFTTVVESNIALSWLSDMFVEFPHPQSYMALLRLILIEKINFHQLKLIVEIKNYWREHPIYWQRRRWNKLESCDAFFESRNGEYALSWKLAFLLFKYRGHYPLEEILPENWVFQWKQNARHKKLSFSFVEYLEHLLVDDYGEHDDPLFDLIDEEQARLTGHWQGGNFCFQPAGEKTMIKMEPLVDFLSTNLRRDSKYDDK
jgi:hypothetical protein|tara:strand:+ start:48044 stop:49264 length:1221 start_codon:yes stop_codon:yes gene_type:complete